MKYFLILLLGVGLIYSCRFIGGKRVKGNGVAETQQRNVSSFDGVASFGAFNVTVITGDAYSVKIEGDENLLEYIETEVDGGTLEINTRRGYNLRPRTDMRITVTAPQFSQLSSHGSGNINGQNMLKSDQRAELQLFGSGNIDVQLEAPSVAAEIAGSGNIAVKGTTKEFSGSIHGSGNIRARDLQSEKSKVEIAGSGDVEVFASNHLDVRIMGSGGVKYHGNAEVSTSIAGSGSVSKVN